VIGDDHPSAAARLSDSDPTSANVDRFMGVVVHDLRNPVAVVRASAQMAMRQYRRGNVDAVLPRLETIIDQTDRLTDLLETFVEAARLSSGPLPLKLERMRLNDVAVHAATRARHSLRRVSERQVELECEADVTGVWDRERVGRALRALIENALLYGDPTVPVKVRVERRGRSALVEVDGAGPGPDASEAGRLFEQFYRGRAAAEAGHAGPGLGLYTARGIARAHGGDVRRDAAAAPDLFVLELPVAT
jgi:signal transduction histidine kinase